MGNLRLEPEGKTSISQVRKVNRRQSGSQTGNGILAETSRAIEQRVTAEIRELPRIVATALLAL